MPRERDAEEVVHLALVPVGGSPETGRRRQRLALLDVDLDEEAARPGHGAHVVVDLEAPAAVGIVHGDDVGQQFASFVLLQVPQHRQQVGRAHPHRLVAVTALGAEDRGAEPLLQLLDELPAHVFTRGWRSAEGAKPSFSILACNSRSPWKRFSGVGGQPAT